MSARAGGGDTHRCRWCPNYAVKYDPSTDEYACSDHLVRADGETRKFRVDIDAVMRAIDSEVCSWTTHGREKVKNELLTMLGIAK